MTEDPAKLDQRSADWNAGYRAGLAAPSREPSVLSIAQALATAAAATARASQALAEAVTAIMEAATKGQASPSLAAEETLSHPFSKPPSAFSKPPPIFSKPPAGLPSSSRSDMSPWTREG